MPLISNILNVINNLYLTNQASDPANTAGKTVVYTKTDGLYARIAGGTVIGPMAGSTASNDYICILDQKAQNTAGGTFTAGAWRTRDLNTEQSDTGNHASVASNQITLEAGTYTARISCPGREVGNHQARLYNITDGALVLTGTSEYCYVPGGVYNRSFVQGKFTLATSKVLEVQHYSSATCATTGFGLGANAGAEIYTVAEFWKVA